MKPGIKTTEFWSTLLTSIIALIAVIHPGFQIKDGLVQVIAVLAAGTAQGSYTFSRSSLKKAVVNSAVVYQTPIASGASG